MMASEVVTKLQELININGDKEFHIYLTYAQETKDVRDIFYDDEIKDICISAYG